MAKDSSSSDQSNNDSPPKFKINTQEIDRLIDPLIEPEARVKAYEEFFKKYLEAIQKEPSIGKKRYYGRYLEDLLEQISTDGLIKDDSKSKKELLSKIASFADILAAPDQSAYIDIHAQNAQIALNSSLSSSLQEATAQAVTEQVSKHINEKLIPWAESHQDSELSAALSLEEHKLWANSQQTVPSKSYSMKGKSFWDSCLSFLDKVTKPKPIKFDVDKETIKYADQFKKDKSSYISTALDFIKKGLINNKAGKILSAQIQENIENLEPSAKSLHPVKKPRESNIDASLPPPSRPKENAHQR